MRKLRPFLSLLLFGTLFPVLAQDRNEQLGASDTIIITALPVTYGLTSWLATGTSIKVVNLPERGRRMNGLANYFESRAEQLADTFAAATAVVTIGKLWTEDPLYTAARGGNVRIVEIDATKPWSTTLEGISVAFVPDQDAPWDVVQENTREPSVFFWQSPANAARAADIIAGDLMRLVPTARGQIERNLLQLRRDLLELKRRYEVQIAMLDDVSVYALAAEFVYLTSDLGLFVDGYFFKQDIDWAEADVSAFQRHLVDNELGVVIHKWEPEAPIAAAIEAAGARLVVLETLDAGQIEDGKMLPESYFELMDRNLSALSDALHEANAD